MQIEWEIEKGEYLRRLGCSEQEFSERLQLPKMRGVRRVVPLKHLARVESVIPLSLDLLKKVLREVKTMSGEAPFRRAEFELMSMNPSHLLVGQKLAYRENYQNLLENVPSFFGRFAIPPGITQLGAYFIFGEDRDGLTSLACYLPPIVERHVGSQAGLIIMDGIHRNFITKQTGGTIIVIIVRNVEIPFPCEPHPWSDLRVIPLAEKPTEMNERYFGLRKELFRDLKYLGIDG